jgi:hypothetical protein
MLALVVQLNRNLLLPEVKRGMRRSGGLGGAETSLWPLKSAQGWGGGGDWVTSRERVIR